MTKIHMPAFERFISNLGFEDIDAFEPTENNLIRAEKLIDAGFSALQASEIMKYGEKAYRAILEFKQDNPGLDLYYAINDSFDNAQVEEMLNAIYYNYAVEFGNLKDRGKEPVRLDSLTNLSASQMFMIVSAANEGLDTQCLLYEGLDENSMLHKLTQLRENRLEVHQQLRNNGHDILITLHFTNFLNF